MCGRFTLEDISFLAAYGIHLVPGDPSPEFQNWRASFNVAPSQEIPVVVSSDGRRELRWMRWGFQPGWFKPNAKQPPPINARAESLLERPMFRGAVGHARCAIPATGFYEWAETSGRRSKQPLHIRLKSRQPFLFAGLYTTAPGSDADEQRLSCAIVTTAANELMAEFHHRMPVILAGDDIERWLDDSVSDPAAVLGCLQQYPAGEMEAYPVGPSVSSARNNGPQLVLPLDE